MKQYRFLSALLAAIMILALASCGGEPASTTPAPGTTETPSGNEGTTAEITTAEATTEEATTDEITTAEATTVETTEAAPVIEYGLNGYGKLDGADLQALVDLMPALLPDGTPIETFSRPFCGDDELDSDGFPMNYYIQGKASPDTTIVGTDGGAIYGQAFRLPAHGESATDRAEIEVSFFNLDGNIENNVKGARGILFWVDFTHVDPAEEKTVCASVTLNRNTYRCNAANNGSVGYYYKDGAWMETKNINACRMELCAGFAGWVYLPASSFVDSNKNPIADENGKFPDIDVTNMRCYTDNYTYSTNEANYIIFDEIIYVF